MDLRQLKYFLAIAEHGSISRAAARLNVAQPALSLHVRNMEDHLGTALLVRQPRGVALTEAGALLERRSRMVLNEVRRIEDDIRNLGADPTGDVRLGLTGTISGLLSVPLVLQTRRRFPQIHLTIAEAMSGFVMDWLREGKIDIAVLYLPAMDAEFRSELILQEELVLLAPPTSDISAPCRFSDIFQEPMILPSPAHGLRSLLDRKAEAEGVRLRAESEVDSYLNIKELVMEGQGSSILPVHAVEADAAAGRLKMIPFAEPRLWRDVFLVRRQPGLAGHACEVVSDLVLELVRDLLQSGRWAGARSPV